ncbi:MAG: hypothetical protein IKT38_07590 [Clostridia bacterium]|nr:hypothetical protein [Clostridia bacterium]
MKLKPTKKTYNISDAVYNVVVNKCEFFVDMNNEAFLVSRNKNNYDLIYLSRADDAKNFFMMLYFNKYKVTVKKADISTAYENICAIVTQCKQQTPVYTRVGYCNNTLYYDLNNQKGEVIAIDKDDVLIKSKSNIKDIYFYEDTSMCNQTEPFQSDYTLFDFIDNFYNIEKEQKLLLAVYMCAAFIPDIKHPILIVEGEKGAGKTKLLSYLSKMINPVTKDVFVLPKKEDDLITTLSNNHFSAFDNIGKLSPDFCNVFCQSSTGGTLSKRKLYSDNREICINIKRLVALNGINLEISQSDLLDRSILMHLNRIDESKRRTDEELDADFQNVLPHVLGDVFFILSKALSIYPTVNLAEYPRMADFSRYGYAIAEAIEEGLGSTFIKTYKDNIKLATESAVQENPVLNSLREFVEYKKHWRGTMTELLNELQKIVRKLYISKSLPSSFPNNANGLSRILNTHKHELKNLDVNVEIGRTTNRYVEVSKIGLNLPTIATNSTTKNDFENRKSLLDED